VRRKRRARSRKKRAPMMTPRTARKVSVRAARGAPTFLPRDHT
jgi:hypothetical protein